MKRTRLLLVVSLCFALVALGTQAAVTEYFAYEDTSLPIEERVADLLARMTLDEKIGQMTLIEKGSITPEAVQEYHIGAVLSGGGGYPTGNNTPQGWQEMVHAYQDAAQATRLGIPLLYGVDAVHGHSNVGGAVIYPHNIGLGAANNPDLIAEIGRYTARDMIGTGIYWNYAPVLAVPRDIRWGRTYEGYSENVERVTQLSLAALRGLQGADLAAPDTVLGTPKHFVADGGTQYGTSPQPAAFLDRGNFTGGERALREVHLAPYPPHIEAGARSIMISYSSVDGERMHGRADLINGVLIDEFGFEGFVVSDWQGIDDVAPRFYDAVVQAINAGIDMNMVPYDYVGFTSTMRAAVENGDIPMQRIDEAVTNILTVKMELGLFENAYGNDEFLAEVGSDEQRALAREAVAQSLVLLKNENDALPLQRDAEQTVFIVGRDANSIGVQNGGWSIEWQGSTANLTEGTTIRSALQNGFGDNTSARYSRSGLFTDDNGEPARADVGIVVVGEDPYAEWFGDSASLALSRGERDLIEEMRPRVDTLIVVLLSGRPLIVDTSLNLADAFVAAWLPGTEADGIADVLFGDRDFVGTTPFTWPRSVEQLPLDFGNIPGPDAGCAAPLFPYDYGLTYASAAEESAPWLALSVECAPQPVTAVQGEVFIPDGDQIAPDGEFGVNYFAAFPVPIELDGQFEDWAGVPRVTLPQPAPGVEVDAALTFAAVADDDYLYFLADVLDDNIITGEHGINWWNEDSVEFYINATDDLETTRYSDGIAQMTIPPINALQPDDPVISGVNGERTGIETVVVETPTGWAVEARVPLQSDFWSIERVSGAEIGFQAHLNGASTGDRDLKLIWSLADRADQSYQNPSVFGRLTFIEVAAADDAPTGDGGADTGETSVTSAAFPPPILDSDNELMDLAGEVLVLDDGREWDLLWNDEFSGVEIDPTRWIHDRGGDGFGNNELQYYSDRPENSRVENGELVIEAREESFRLRNYTSAKLWSVASVNLRYGRIDIRARLPQGQGIWPAFWMLPIQNRYGGWPASGEIDIMEMVGHEANVVHGTLHYTGDARGSHVFTGASYTLDEGIFADGYHVFSLVWEPDRFEWYVDGELYQVQTEWQTAGEPYPAPFDQPFYLILNLAVGGDWPGSPDETTVFPQTMHIDYVRVFQQGADSGGDAAVPFANP